MERWNFTYWIGLVLLALSLLLEGLAHQHLTANAIGLCGVLCVGVAFYLAHSQGELQ